MTKSCAISFLLAMFSILSSTTLFASPQMPDYLVYKKDTIVTYNLLVEQYLQKIEIIQPDRLFGLSFRDGGSLNCWRGYQAIYKVDNDSLFVAAIINCGEKSSGNIDTARSAIRMIELFKNKVVNGKVYIDWFSGDISFPLTNKILRWDGVFYKIYENETVISIANGKVLNIADVDNYEDDPKAINRKDRNKLSDILFKQIKKIKWVSIDSFDCSDKYLVTIGTDGKVSKVTMPEYPTQDSIDKYWDKDEYSYCINNMLKAFRKLKFDILKDKGKPVSEDVYIEVWFDSRRKIENWTR